MKKNFEIRSTISTQKIHEETMLQNGLMILNYQPKLAKFLLQNVGNYLNVINSKITKTLYVSLFNNGNNLNQFENPNNNNSNNDYETFLKYLQHLIPAIYVEANNRAPLLDVRVLHHGHYHHHQHFMIPENKSINMQQRSLRHNPEILFLNEQWKDETIVNYLKQFNLNYSNMTKLQLSPGDNSFGNETIDVSTDGKQYDYVCIGGTFDNLHNGHKILLSTAQLKCNKKLTIGVTTKEMLKTKILSELIESSEKRVEILNEYLTDVDPYIDYDLCEISDPFGPAIVDSDLQAIIVSEETVHGGEKINEIRNLKQMKPLKIDIIKLLQDNHKQSHVEEEKVSSSSLRIRKLGTLIRPPEPKPNLPDKPYLIGLTGMIASGKSSIGKKLESLGAGLINVDGLAHKTYGHPSLPVYRKIVEIFGTDIVDQRTGQIDRRKLGAIVFDDEQKLKTLNSIVWPEVRKLLQQEIDQMRSKYPVIVLEIALLIENKRMDQVHQIWLTILEEKEVIRRLMERNQLTESEARKRMEKLMPCREKVPYANVVFCTKWSEEFTMQQVQRAWKMLNDKFVSKIT